MNIEKSFQRQYKILKSSGMQKLFRRLEGLILLFLKKNFLFGL